MVGRASHTNPGVCWSNSGRFRDQSWDAFEGSGAKTSRRRKLALHLGMTIDAVYAAKSRILRRLREEVLALADDLPNAIPT